ncbi:MAG: ABC-F family ATP-binding cassette domain-containing protein [Chloroflexota bacterium]|nr:ABC-F family ATP-binding cassette domain-containing protein [Chloroflexota bacterium]
MSILTASNLAKSYGPHDVFEGVSLEIPHGAKIALVGPNGSGKTTLLHLIMGLEEPTAGTIYRAKGPRFAYLPQQADFYFSAGAGTLWEAMQEIFADLRDQADELRRLEASMADPATREGALQRYGPTLESFELAGGYTYEQCIRQVLSGLGFDEEVDFQRPVAQLSGGQKTRALLARLLLEEPDLLLLDEPTNHLDLAGIEWLEGYLKTWKGAVVIVAHDRAFLDAVVERVWEMAWGQLEQYRGNYSAYVVQKAEQMARQQAEYDRQQQSISRTEEFIHRNIVGQRSREAQGRRKRLAQVERIERPRGYRPMGLTLGDSVARSGDLVLGLYDLTVGYAPAASLFTAGEFELRRGQRVVLLGPNGSGKTTLVRTILGDILPLAGRVRVGASVHLGYFAQGHADLDPDQTVLETILDAGELKVGQARDWLGRYRFSGDDVFKRIGDLSGGEQARVALAVLALQGANVLILDEPTNHLDIPSQEVLQDVLSGFGGTLLIVTHDRYLIRKLATCVWVVEDGQLWEFEEGYEEYRDWEMQRRQQIQSHQTEETRAKTEREQAREAYKAAKRRVAQRARRQAELERKIHQLEVRRAQLEAQLSAASEQQEIERVRQLGIEYASVEAELDTLLVAWADEA